MVALDGGQLFHLQMTFPNAISFVSVALSKKETCPR